MGGFFSRNDDYTRTPLVAPKNGKHVRCRKKIKVIKIERHNKGTIVNRSSNTLKRYPSAEIGIADMRRKSTNGKRNTQLLMEIRRSTRSEMGLQMQSSKEVKSLKDLAYDCIVNKL